MILIIDAGNSRVKWGWHDGKEWTSVATVSLIEFAASSDHVNPFSITHEDPERIVISNVAGEGAHHLLVNWTSIFDVEPLWLPVRVRERVDFEVHPAAILLNPLRAAPVEVHLKRASTSDARLVSVESRHERLGASIVPGEGPSECSLVVSFLGPPAPQPRELTSLVLRVEGGAHAEQVIPVAIVSAP